MAESYLLYDGECPACRSYVALARLRQHFPDIRVLDARREADRVAALRGRGFEINDGMVLCLDGVIYFGPEATRMIGVMERPVAALAPRLTLAFIGTAPWSRRLYPMLNGARQMLLRLLGRKLIA
jgi:predicted DCC family thiol-disulfide oxidoreductase YuxK